MRRFILPMLFTLIFLNWRSSYALSEPFSVSGHVKTQITRSKLRSYAVANQFSPERPTESSTEFRMNGSGQFADLDIEVAGEAIGLSGDGLQSTSFETGSPSFLKTGPTIFANESRRLFDLSQELNDDENLVSAARIDRLVAGFSSDQAVVKLGRQAVSWGNGLVFQALDPFNPFAPTAIDKDYKTGDDLAYAQWLFDSGDDIQFLGIPRRDPATGTIKDDQGTAALKWHGRVNAPDLDYDLVVATHYDEVLYGIGGSRELLGAVFRADVGVTELSPGGHALQYVLNLDRSWVICNTNVYSFIEYFQNSIGTSNSEYTSVSAALTERLSRGELFTLAKHYLAGGWRVEATPLINLYPSMIYNLDDTSGIAQLRVEYSAAQNLTLIFGGDLPFGGRGSEFGGITSPSPDLYFSSPSDIYARVAYYF